ncbi:uncharacterized protein LOC118438529 [Folsomia candida]|uniref:uncharacterized protein LOC118438529 n=1 Tax=Folsomia candida TaxID=158441 RepID=UPI001604C0F2|nr:uncharacterized protein LOC118438529 [Folsomia candida]
MYSRGYIFRLVAGICQSMLKRMTIFMKTAFILVLVAVAHLPVATFALKCFICIYDTDRGHNSDTLPPSSPAAQCLRDTPSIQLLKECGDPHEPSGIMLCANSSIHDEHSRSVSRECTEHIRGKNGSSSSTTCSTDPSDGFTTCLCETDGCNVPIFDATYDVPVEKGADVDVGKIKPPEVGDEGDQDEMHSAGWSPLRQYRPSQNLWKYFTIIMFWGMFCILIFL